MHPKVDRLVGGALLAVAVLLAVGPAHGQTMKMVVTQIPMPADETAQPLEGLKYGQPWVVEFTSISVVRDLDKNLAQWTVTGSSGRARPERVQIVVKLLDASGKDIAAAKKSTIVKTGGDSYEYVIKMKVKPEVWDAAETVKIFVNFFIAA